MDMEQIRELIAELEKSKLSKLTVKKGDFEIHLEKPGLVPPAPKPHTVSAETESAFQSEVPHKGERGGSRAVEKSGTFVVSPMVGTFYSSPAPDQPVFVKIGDKVSENTIVCIVEAMKVMNEVKAGIAGTVAEVLLDNAQPVEFGTPLLRIT